MKKRILYLGNDLTDPSFTTTYICFLREGLRAEGALVKSASAEHNKLLRLVDMLYLVWKYRKWTEVVLIDTYGSLNFYYAYCIGRLCQLLKLKYFPILHGGNLPERLSGSKRLCENLFANAGSNIAPSLYLYKIFEAHNFRNLCLIPNAIHLADYQFKVRPLFRPRLLWVRRFQKRYNPMLALEVFRELRTHYPQAQLCMVGPEKDGSLKTCKVYAKKHRLPVLFPGKLEKKEWTALAAAYDIFLNTTQIDNTPISVIEAQALGLAVVSTEVGGMPFLVEHQKDGILVPPNNRPKMLAAIQELLQDQEKTKELVIAGRKKVEKFDWEVVKEQWKKLLDLPESQPVAYLPSSRSEDAPGANPQLFRLLELGVALLGLGCTALLIPLVLTGNLLANRGRLFYSQERVGEKGQKFQILKFRTMRADTENPRITGFGSFLRRSHLDEFPQFYNILKGEMSLIGPRPERTSCVREYSRILPLYEVRHQIKPGLTGWAQVMAANEDTIGCVREKLHYDLQYISNRDLFLDLLILLKSIKAVVFLQGQ